MRKHKRKLNTKMKTNFFSLAFLLLINIIYSQNIGDFRSIASGDWNDSTKWQTYNGTNWVAATQYPGQTSGNYSVSIEDGHTITVGTYGNGNNSPSSTSIYNIGDLIVKGQLTLNINLELNDTSYLLIDAGTVAWNQNNVYLKLKGNAEVSIINTGSGNCNNGSGINGYGLVGASCSNQNSLIIGNLTYSNCAGSGNAAAGDFCDVNQSGGTINATPTSSPSSLCYNSSQNNSVILTAPDNLNIILTKTYTWYLDSAPTNFSGFSTQNTQSLTVNNLIPGNYTFILKISITKSENTYTSEGTVTVTVHHPTSPGTINSLNICSKYNTGNTLTLSGYFGSIVKWQSSTASDFSSNVTDIANTQDTLLLPDKLTTEMYYRAVLSNGSCSGFSAVASIKSLSTTYNGSGWSNGLPDTTKKAIFTNNYALQDNITACSAEISNNAIVTVPEGKNFTINNELEVNSGNLIVESDANLVQVNNTNHNTGNITVKRKAKMKRLDYTYWSSSVSGQNLKNFSSSTLDSRFYVYNESNDYFDGLFIKNSYPNNTLSITNIEDKNTYTFTKGKGYAIRAPNNYTTSNTTNDWTFVGIPNNGIITLPVQRNGNGFNLIGNPFPSNISFSQFYSANSSIIDPIAYFWTNVNPNPPIIQGSSYDGANYAIRNLTGGVGAVNSTIAPTDEIVVGQGFIIKKTNVGNANIIFNNSMRTSSKGTFFNARTASTDNKIWLKLTTPAKNFNTLLIGYVKGATDGLDRGYDAEPITQSSDMFYSVIDNKNLVIQGRNNSFTNNDIVTLGATFFEKGNYEISISQVEGIFNGSQAVYLRDKTLNKTINLSQENYPFYADAGDVKNRFEIVYKPDATLATSNIVKNEEISIYESDGKIFLENKSEKFKKIEIFDTAGKLIYTFTPNTNLFSIEKSDLNKGLFIFNTSSNSKTTSKKFVVK